MNVHVDSSLMNVHWALANGPQIPAKGRLPAIVGADSHDSKLKEKVTSCGIDIL
jgi:hypothetical protein